MDISRIPFNAIEGLLKMLNVKMNKPASPTNSIHPSAPFLWILEGALWIKSCISVHALNFGAIAVVIGADSVNLAAQRMLSALQRPR